MKINPARSLALELLNRVSLDDAYANLLMPKLLAKAKLSDRDAGFAQELAFGTLRWQLTYDAILDLVSSRPTKEIDSVLLNCLRLGVHQLMQMRVPTHAAISETVELVRANCGEKVVGFSNGILRKVSTMNFEQWIEKVTKGLVGSKKLALQHSHPEWIVQALNQSLVADGIEDQLADLLAANNQPALVNYVALPGLADSRAFENAVADKFSPFGFYLRSGTPKQLRALSEGSVRVQDEGSQLAALALTSFKPIQKGESWLDMCAGPGGKAALLAAIAEQNGCSLVANEVQPHRAKLVAEALEPFKSVEVICADGRELGQQSEKFDRILVDAPCSGLGALRRRPEARWRKNASDIKELTNLQLELIESGLNALKPGGILLYVTCSPHPAETTAVIDKARRSLPVEVLDLTSVMNEKYMHNTLPAGRKTIQLHTQRDNTDGMFMAMLGKAI